MPQSLHCLVVHEDAHPSYKRYKVKKLCFIDHSRYISTSIHKHTFFFLFFLFKSIKKAKTNILKCSKKD